jgi:hypothetical protein
MIDIWIVLNELVIQAYNRSTFKHHSNVRIGTGYDAYLHTAVWELVSTFHLFDVAISWIQLIVSGH